MAGVAHEDIGVGIEFVLVPYECIVMTVLAELILTAPDHDC